MKKRHTGKCSSTSSARGFSGSSKNAIFALLLIAAAFAAYSLVNAATVSHKGSEVLPPIDADTLGAFYSAAGITAKLNDIDAKLLFAQGGGGGAAAQTFSQSFSLTKDRLTGRTADGSEGTVTAITLPDWLGEGSNCILSVGHSGFSADGEKIGTDAQGYVTEVYVENPTVDGPGGGSSTYTTQIPGTDNTAKTFTFQRGGRRCTNFQIPVYSSDGAFSKASGHAFPVPTEQCFRTAPTTGRITVSQVPSPSDDPNTPVEGTFVRVGAFDNPPPGPLFRVYEWPTINNRRYVTQGEYLNAENSVLPNADSCRFVYDPANKKVDVTMRTSGGDPGSAACSVSVQCRGRSTFGNVVAYFSGGSGTCVDRCATVGMSAVCGAANAPSAKEFQIACASAPDTSPASGCWCSN